MEKPDKDESNIPVTYIATEKAKFVIQWLLDVIKQRKEKEPLVESGDIDPWYKLFYNCSLFNLFYKREFREYDLLAYDTENSKPFPSLFLAGLRKTPWVPTQLGMFPPSNIFVTEINMYIISFIKKLIFF